MSFPLSLVFGLLTILLCLNSLYRIYRRRPPAKIHWLLFAIGSMLSCAFLFFAAPWAFLSFYLRWLYLLLYLCGLTLSIRKMLRLPWKAEDIRLWFILRQIITIGIYGPLLYFFAAGHVYNGKATALRFPFKHDNYYVMQGGSNRMTNFFHRGFNQKMFGYAMDIAQFNEWGSRSAGISSRNLHDYAIYGDTVYCPANATVLEAVDSVEDNPPGTFNTRYVHGNHIILQAAGYRIFMAHMQRGKVFVSKGQRVRAGQPLALIGNSGFTAEPHLHITVLRDYKKEDLYSGISTPITFGGRFYALNDIIRPQAEQESSLKLLNRNTKMKTLYLMRHGQAESRQDQPDIERNLNATGRREAHEMGENLLEAKLRPALIISSNANRAYQTAEIVAEILTYPVKNIQIEKGIYHTDEETVIDIIERQEDQYQSIMITGHNPMISELASHLAGKEVDMATASIICFQGNANSWKEFMSGDLKQLFYHEPGLSTIRLAPDQP